MGYNEHKSNFRHPLIELNNICTWPYAPYCTNLIIENHPFSIWLNFKLLCKKYPNTFCASPPPPAFSMAKTPPPPFPRAETSHAPPFHFVPPPPLPVISHQSPNHIDLNPTIVAYAVFSQSGCIATRENAVFPYLATIFQKRTLKKLITAFMVPIYRIKAHNMFFFNAKELISF